MGRRHTARERERLIELVRTSDTPVKVVAERLGVSASTAYLWVKRAPETPKLGLARVVPVSMSTGPKLTVAVGDAVIQLEAGFDADLLRQVVSALSRVPS